MKRLVEVAARVLAATVALAALFAVGWGVWKGVGQLWAYLGGVPTEMGVALVVAAPTVFVSTLTIVLGRYFERKRELDALYRDKKVEFYDEFLQKLFPILYGTTNPQGQSEDVVAFLRESVRKLLLWSGPEPIASFVKWKQNLAGGVPDAQTIFLMEEFLLALRRDLRHSNRGIPTGFFAHFFLREANLFLTAARRNPRITLQEVAELEKNQQATGHGNAR
jgi:hypothetical protein